MTKIISCRNKNDAYEKIKSTSDKIVVARDSSESGTKDFYV